MARLKTGRWPPRGPTESLKSLFANATAALPSVLQESILRHCQSFQHFLIVWLEIQRRFKFLLAKLKPTRAALKQSLLFP